MERKSPSNRNRLVNLRAAPPIGEIGDRGLFVGPPQEIVSVSLGDRLVFSDAAEIWTVRGILRDGQETGESIGEMSFVMMPGAEEPATAVTGFIAPAPPYTLAVAETALWPQIRRMVVQLGYDVDGFYASIATGGRYSYYEDFRQEH